MGGQSAHVRLRRESSAPRLRFLDMACRHDGFREIQSDYDASAGVLVYHWTCEHCSTRIAEAGRTAYRPAFDPRGNDQYLDVGGEPPALSA